LAGGVGGVVSADDLHFWLPCPLQVHIWTSALFSVLAPSTSRHRPDCTPVMEPSALRVHF
jgi:hypothetical protein